MYIVQSPKFDCNIKQLLNYKMHSELNFLKNYVHTVRLNKTHMFELNPSQVSQSLLSLPEVVSAKQQGQLDN